MTNLIRFRMSTGKVLPASAAAVSGVFGSLPSVVAAAGPATAFGALVRDAAKQPGAVGRVTTATRTAPPTTQALPEILGRAWSGASRLSESNRRPTHYEFFSHTSKNVQFRSRRRSGGCTAYGEPA